MCVGCAKEHKICAKCSCRVDHTVGRYTIFLHLQLISLELLELSRIGVNINMSFVEREIK